MVTRVWMCGSVSRVCEEKLVGLCQVCARVSCAVLGIAAFFCDIKHGNRDREFYERAVKP